MKASRTRVRRSARAPCRQCLSASAAPPPPTTSKATAATAAPATAPTSASSAILRWKSRAIWASVAPIPCMIVDRGAVRIQRTPRSKHDGRRSRRRHQQDKRYGEPAERPERAEKRLHSRLLRNETRTRNGPLKHCARAIRTAALRKVEMDDRRNWQIFAETARPHPALQRSAHLLFRNGLDAESHPARIARPVRHLRACRRCRPAAATRSGAPLHRATTPAAFASVRPAAATITITKVMIAMTYGVGLRNVPPGRSRLSASEAAKKDGFILRAPAQRAGCARPRSDRRACLSRAASNARPEYL